MKLKKIPKTSFRKKILKKKISEKIFGKNFANKFSKTNFRNKNFRKKGFLEEILGKKFLQHWLKFDENKIFLLKWVEMDWSELKWDGDGIWAFTSKRTGPLVVLLAGSFFRF